ncbi:hypothetical protein LLG95_15755 [bacterium]|nr:hypothetical protein [bacterium]
MRFLWQFTFVIVISLIGSLAEAQTDGQRIDVSKIADPKIKAIAEAINKRQANISELVVKETFVSFDDAKPIYTHISRIMERRPDKFYKRMITYEGDQQTSGTICTDEEEFFDGRYGWAIVRYGPAYKGKDPKTGETRISKLDFEPLKKAGVEYDPENTFYRLPAAAFERRNPKLDRETLTEWVLSETLRNNQIRIVYHVSKLSGLCTKFEHAFKNHKMVNELDEISINPNPPLGDSKFSYRPPVGANVEDMTQLNLELLAKKRRLAREKSQAGTGKSGRNSDLR